MLWLTVDCREIHPITDWLAPQIFTGLIDNGDIAHQDGIFGYNA